MRCDTIARPRRVVPNQLSATNWGGAEVHKQSRTRCLLLDDLVGASERVAWIIRYDVRCGVACGRTPVHAPLPAALTNGGLPRSWRAAAGLKPESPGIGEALANRQTLPPARTERTVARPCLSIR